MKNWLHIKSRWWRQLSYSGYPPPPGTAPQKRYIAEGAEGIAHKNRGRKPAHAIPEKVRKHVAELYQSKYYGSNNIHFTELLQEHESLEFSVSSVRRILLEHGIKQTKQKRRKKGHQPRIRKPQAGMLWQIDASPYA